MAPSATDQIAALSALVESSVTSLKEIISNNRVELLAKLEEVQLLRTELTVVKKQSAAQGAEILELKTKVNEFEQSSKSKSIRVFGIIVPKEEEEALGANRAAIKRVYDKVIKPILVVAKAKNMIDTVPQLNNCVAEGYRAGLPPKAGKSGPPPPCVIKFVSKDIRDVILKLKKDNTPPPPCQEEKAAGVKRVVVVEDLTPSTHRKLKELVAQQEFEKVWTINGYIRFTLTGDPDKIVRKLSSPFLSNTEILAKLN